MGVGERGKGLVDKVCVGREVRGWVFFFLLGVLLCYLLVGMCIRIYLASLLGKFLFLAAVLGPFAERSGVTTGLS